MIPAPVSWTTIRDRWRKPEPSAWPRFITWGDTFMDAHPFVSMACSVGAVAGFVLFAVQAAALARGG